MEMDIKSLINTEKWVKAFSPSLLSNKVNHHWFSDYFIISDCYFDITKKVDKILVLDVVDHTLHPHSFMMNLEECCTPDTVVEMLVHPYTSRLATHNTNNKAFSHFFGICNKRHNGFITDSDYRNLFQNFEVIGVERYKQNVEDWFFAPCFKSEMEKIGYSLDSTEFQTNMINYTLKLCQ